MVVSYTFAILIKNLHQYAQNKYYLTIMCFLLPNVEQRDYYLAKMLKLGVLLSGHAILYSKWN